MGDGNFQSGSRYPGPATTFCFENGTYTTISTVATVFKDFTGVDSGEAFFKIFCTGQFSLLTDLTNAAAGSPASTPTSPSIVTPTETPTDTPGSSPTTSEEPEPTATGYPYPVVLHSKMYIGGYFLNGSFSDTAVLTVYTFSPEGDDWIEFRSVSEKFIAQCVQAGKTKLIIDLRGNDGGLPPLAYDIFKRLFPNSGFPYDPTRFRNHEAYALLSQWYSEYFTDTDLAHKNNPGSVVFWTPDTGLNYRTLMTGDMHPFESWEDMYGPTWEYNGDNFTSISVFDVRLIYSCHSIECSLAER